MTVDLIPVCVGACLCPGTPHADGDFVYLRPKLSFLQASAVKYDIVLAREAAGGHLATSVVLAILSKGYVTHGIDSWNLTDGKAIPVTDRAIESEILEQPQRAWIVAEEADGLYGEQVMLPLLMMGSKSSPNTSSSESTSATNGHSPSPRKRSKRSSTTTSPTVSTEATT